MRDNKKELVFVFSLLVISCWSFFRNYTGVSTSEVSVKKVIDKIIFYPHNCFNSKPNKYLSQKFQSVKGFFVPCAESEKYFLGRSINFVPTCEKWKAPVVESCFDKLMVFKLNAESEVYSAQLTINPELKLNKSLPIISIMVDPKDLFSNENGIYVAGNENLFKQSPFFYTKPWNINANYFLRGKSSKRNVSFTYYDEQGDARYTSIAKISIAGNATRSFPQKSVCIEENKKAEKFHFDFFHDSIYYPSIVLRNGGNDWTKTLISDGVMQSSMSKYLPVLNYQPCLVYINGQFWGIHSMRNKMDEKSLASIFNVNKNSVTVMENWSNNYGNKAFIVELNDFLARTPHLKGDEVYMGTENLIDMDNLMYYLAGQIYYANTDWPSNNIKAFRIDKDGTISKWKFVFFDLDYGMGYTGSQACEKDMFAYLKEHKSPMGKLFKALLKSNEFKSRFKTIFNKLLSFELSKNSIAKIINNYESQLKPYMKLHIHRWRMPNSLYGWEQNIASLKHFVANRKNVIEKQINLYLTSK